MLTTEQRPDGWWIVDDELQPGGLEPMGSYQRRTDAENDRRGVARMLRNENDRSFFTTGSNNG